MHRSKYFSYIDGLRAISVFLVFFYHLWPEKISGGYLGVDIFFVISGLVISKSIFEEKLITGKIQLYNFYVRRIKRIFPALIVVVVSTTSLYFFLGYLSQNQQIVETAITALVAISNLYFLKYDVDYFLINTINPLEHTWSLGVEEQFYIFYPCILALICFYVNDIKSNVKNNIFFTLLILFIISISIFIFFDNQIIGNFFSPVARAWQLLTGCLLYFLIFADTKALNKFRISNKILQNIILYTSVIILVYLCIFTFDKSNFRTGSIIITFLAAFIIATFYHRPNFYLLSNKFSIFFGNISYSIYLWHLPIIYFFELYFTGYKFYLFTILTTILISSFSYFYIERPIRNCKLFIEHYQFKFKNVLSYSLITIIFLIVITGTTFRKEIRNEIAKLNLHTFDFNFFEKELRKNNVSKDRLSKNYKFIDKNAHQFCREFNKTLLSENEIPNTMNCFHENKNSNKLLILMGDSHAFHYLPAIGDLFDTFDVYHSYSPCLFSNKLASANFNEENSFEIVEKCLNSIRNMVLKVKYFEKKYSNGSVTLILSNRSNYRINNMTVYDQNLHPISNKEEVYFKYYDSLKSIVSSLSSKTNILHILPTPEFRNIEGISNICIISNKNFCVIDKEIHIKNNIKLNDIHYAMQKELPNFYNFDFTDDLCINKKCKIFNHETDMLFFSDNNHLSLETSKRIGKKLQYFIIENAN